ncbi:MAG: TIGR02147 family protein [Alphaproteobacteria bacterium]|nr:TIGR02147 family protein [Alphaproteobacteria bacterium]
MAPGPDITGYLDYRSFLRDWFEARKATNPRFSHRAFVRRVGQKSPSLLADVIARRRNLTPELTLAFAEAMKLDDEDQRFFVDLVALDQAAEPDERDAAFVRLSASRRFREARRVEGASYRYLSCWYIPAVRELVRRPDFRRDPAWIAGLLVPEIALDQAVEALEVLDDLGMLAQRDDGRWVQAEGAIVTPREVAGMAVHNYHQGMLRLARQAITRHKAAERHYMAVTVCIPESLMPELKAELNAMTERILERCDGADGDPERVYQVHLHAFPLSRSPEEK